MTLWIQSFKTHPIIILVISILLVVIIILLVANNKKGNKLKSESNNVITSAHTAQALAEKDVQISDFKNDNN